MGVRSKKPTLKTIAYMTGLGITTVSKALKDAPDIKDSTKERVKLIAKQIGYQPDRAGRSLRTGKTNVICLVLDAQEEISSMMTEFAIGVTDKLQQNSFNLVLTPYWQRSDPLTCVRDIVDSRGADGIIMSQIEAVDQRVEYISKAGMPFVTHGRTRMGLEHAYYDFDCGAFARQSVHFLAERGAKRVALLTASRQFSFVQFMYEGYFAGLQECGLEDCALDDITLYDSREGIAVYVAKLLREKNRPDAFVCGSVNAAVGVFGGVERAGLVVGEDVNIVVKQSGGNLLKWFGRPVYAYTEDFRGAGRGIAESLLKVIAGEPVTDHQTLIAPDSRPRFVLDSV